MPSRPQDPAAWLRAHDASPLAALPRSKPYRQEFSDDGRTWAEPRTTTAEHVHLTATYAEMDNRHVEIKADLVVIVRLPAGHLVRFTPA